MKDILSLNNFVKGDMQELDTMLVDSSKNKSPLVSGVVSHIIANGKRIRPILLFLVSKAFNTKQINTIEGHSDVKSAILKSAFAIELIHTASLLHDDVIDKTKTRRGKKTANIIWGDKQTILVGDYLFTQAFLAISSLQNHKATQIIANACHNLTKGEISQLENEQNTALSLQNYLEIIYNKTASLFEASAMLGGLFLQNEQNNELADFGKQIGLVFQMMDDYLDYFGTKTGKDIGSDFNEKKITLPIILLKGVALKEEFMPVHKYFQKNGNFTLPELQTLMYKHNIKELCKDFMSTYIENSQELIQKCIPDSKVRGVLSELIEFFTKREF